MCHIFAVQPPASYRPVTRSFRLRDHATSVRLEAKAWQIVDEIAAAQGLSTPQFLARIRMERNGTNVPSRRLFACSHRRHSEVDGIAQFATAVERR